MAANLSFNLNGALPLSMGGSSTPSMPSGTSPYAKALSSAQSTQPLVGPLKSNPNNYSTSGLPLTPYQQSFDPSQTPKQPGLISPSTPVKSHTVTNVDGSTVSQTYHAPVPQNNASSTPGLINPNFSGVTTDASTPTPIPPQNSTYPGLISSLASKASQPSADYTAAMQKAQQINEELAKSKTNLAGSLADNSSNPIPIEFQQGRAQVLTTQGLAQQNALASELAGETNLLGAANTQQGTQQSGLISAAGLSAPTQVSYNNQYLNPQTGQPINPQAGNDMQTAVALQVQKLKAGTTDPASAAAALSAYGQAGTNALQQALGTGFNSNIASGNASAQGQTAATQSQQVQQYTSALQQGKNLQSQLSDLITTFGLNPNDINAVNSGLQTIARNTSSPQYKILSNYVNDIANTYAQILTPTGGSQTDTTRGIAASMLDATAKGTSILSVMQSLDQAAQAKIAGVPTLSGNTQSNGQSSSNLYDF